VPPKEPIATEEAAKDQSSSAPDSAAGPTEKSKAAQRERIAVLTLGGPLLLDVHFTLDGRPHTEVFDEHIKQVLDAAHADKDGRPTWQKLFANEKYLAGIQPNMPPVGSRQIKMWIERYDENRDGQIQRDEAASWLGRDTGTSVSAFALRSSRSYQPNPRATSRVWQLLDSDRSGGLSSEEISAAAARLLLFDADDDRVIAPAELATLREQLDSQNPQLVSVGREASRYAAIHLEPELAADRLEYLLSDQYSPRQMLGPASFPELHGLFSRLDANQDDWLEQLELADLLAIEPHIELAAAFTNSGKPEQAAAVLTLTGHAPEVSIIAQSADRIVVSLGSTRLIISAHDLMPGQATGQELLRSQIRAMVHDQSDAVFEQIDANADGRLGEREITSCPERLTARDADGDGQIATDELSYSMIVALLRGERANEQSFYTPNSAAAPSKGDAASSWFTRADFNRDGDISRREFLGSLEQFSRLDTNQNGFIGPEEIAEFKPNTSL
jgi:Ca2+-binding EF-hand superfamily protein